MKLIFLLNLTANCMSMTAKLVLNILPIKYSMHDVMCDVVYCVIY